jgi:hypothetical protein
MGWGNVMARSFGNLREKLAMTNQSVEQAKQTFINFDQAAQEVVSTFDQWIGTSQIGAQGIGLKVMKNAQRNVLSAFDFAQKVAQAKDLNELIRMQADFVQWQLEALGEQLRNLGETAGNVTAGETTAA